jgi:hypothetical protein
MMASPKDVVLDQLNMGLFLIEKFTEDLSDAEYFQPPIEGANHAGWILGHLAYSEDWVVSLVTGVDRRIPQSTEKLFKGGSHCLPDASKYPSRSEIDKLFRNSRTNAVEALKAFDEGRWGEPSPEEAPTEFFPTLGSLWAMQSTHQFWHIGHLSVCRTAMKKKRILQ